MEPHLKNMGDPEANNEVPWKEITIEELKEKIVNISEGSIDIPRMAKSVLSKKVYQDESLLNRIKKLENIIEEPEKLLRNSKDIIISEDNLQQTSDIFKPIQYIIDKITDFQKDYPLPGFEELEELKVFYEKFVQNLCMESKEKRGDLLEIKAILSVEGMPFYRVSQRIARSFTTKEYCFWNLSSKSKTQTGNRPVQSLSGVHFKCLGDTPDSDTPGLEFAAYSLSKSLCETIPLVTPSTLIRLESILLSDFDLIQDDIKIKVMEGDYSALNNIDMNKVPFEEKEFYVQATQTVGSKNLYEFIDEKYKQNQEDYLEKFCKYSLTWNILFSLLLCPGDGKSDNYSVALNEQGLYVVVGIDNDKIFYPEKYKIDTQSTKDFLSAINCIFYTFIPLMDKMVIDQKAKEDFLKINPTLVVIKWLGMLYSQNLKYASSMDKNALDYFGLPIKIPKGFLKRFSEKINLIKQVLSDKPNITPHGLLFKCDNLNAEYYEALRKKYNDPLETMSVIHKTKDANGERITLGTVLNITPDHRIWEETDKKRVPEFIDSVVESTKNFIGEDYTDRMVCDIFSYLIMNFKGYEKEVLPTLPNKIWHLMVKYELKEKNVYSYLKKNFPEGIDLVFDVEGLYNVSPLDIAYHYVLASKGENYFHFELLVEHGASNMNFSGKDFRKLKNLNIPKESKFWLSFHKLKNREIKIDWVYKLETIFPYVDHTYKQKKILGTFLEHRMITETVDEQLNSPVHKVQSEPRDVYKIEVDDEVCYVKFYPALVGIEEAVGELTRRLIGFGAPYGELYKFPDGRPAWISQEIKGYTLKAYLDNKQDLSQIDPVSLSLMTIVAMLINPEDGKPDNYIVEVHPEFPGKFRIACPDNDHGFVPAFVKKTPDRRFMIGPKEIVVQVKTILYCLDHMNYKIPKEVKDKLKNQNPELILKDWLDKLQRINSRYSELFNSASQENFIKEKKCYVGIPFVPKSIERLYSKWMALIDILHNEPEITHLGLLRKLEPNLADRYAEILNIKKSPIEKFMETDGIFYKKINNSLISHCDSNAILISQGIASNYNIIDKIKNHQDIGPAQAMTELEEIAKKWDKLGSEFNDLKVHFRKQEYLKNHNFEHDMPSKQNTILTKITEEANEYRKLYLKNCHTVKDAFFNQFTQGNLVNLNLKGCINITESVLFTDAFKNIMRLTLSGIPIRNIGGGAFATSFLLLPKLETLILNDCTELLNVYLDAPALHNFSSRRAGKLTILKIRAREMKNMSLSGCSLPFTSILELITNATNSLQKLDLSDNPKIEEFIIPGPLRLIDELNLDNCSTLKTVSLESPTLALLSLKNAKSLRSVQLVDAMGLKNLIIEGSQISDAEIIEILQSSPYVKLQLKDLEGTMPFCKLLSEAKSFSEIPEINLQAIKFNRIKDFPIKSFTNLFPNIVTLKLVNCMVSKEASNISRFSSLTMADLSENEIQGDALKFTFKMETLTELHLRSNSIDDNGANFLSQSKTIKHLVLSNNKITDVGFNNLLSNTTITYLDLSDNKITLTVVENLSKNTTLKKLVIKNNEIADEGGKEMQKNSSIVELNLSNNFIANLGTMALSKNTTITDLDLSDNDIRDNGIKYFAENTTLKRLNLKRNGITNEGVKALSLNSSITNLNLSYNFFGDETAESIKDNSTLIKLNLTRNKFSDNGAAILAKNSTLKELYLSLNAIYEGAKHFSKYSTLTKLDLKSGDDESY